MRRCVVVTAGLIAVLFREAPGQTRPDSTALVLANVTVIDGTGAPPRPGMTVVITAGRIAAVGKAGELRPPAGADLIDASGKFLIPGLMDMHVHSAWDPYFVGPLMLANGVTGVRDLFAADWPAVQARRRDVAEGRARGPRILGAGPIVDGPSGPWPGSTIVATGAEARAAVDRVKAAGFDYVKVYSGLSRESYFAIADQSKRDGIPFLGHLPDVISATEASNAGQRSLEHLYGLSLATSNREDELRRQVVNPGPAPKGRDPRMVAIDVERAELDSYRAEKAESLYATFRRNDTWLVPTLTVIRNAALIGDPRYVDTLRQTPQIRYVPRLLAMMWNLALRFAGQPLPAEAVAVKRRYFAWQLSAVGAMQKAGVGLLAGTDTPNAFVYPGFSLHDELGLMVQAGLTPMEAIQAATRNPARFLGKLDEMGTIETGKIADLDLLDANPLDDISNTRALHAVILGGRLLPRHALDSLLASAESHRWRASPAGLLLARLIARRLRALLLAALVVVTTAIFGFYRWRGSVRNRRPATA